MLFADRADAGRQLARLVGRLQLDRPVVIGLARGGVPVAREVAAHLGAPLDVMVVRKIGAPGSPEFAIGAVARGVLHLDEAQIYRLGVPESFVRGEAVRQLTELGRREQVYRRGQAPRTLKGATVVLVDDGLASGASARVAIAAVRQQDPARVVLAVPVAAPETADLLRPLVDQLVAVAMPANFMAVGTWYQDFVPTTDAEVLQCLRQTAGDDHPDKVA